MAIFRLYGRVYCHLCHEMAGALGALLAEYGLKHEQVVEEIDLDEFPELDESLGERIPVLKVGERELCFHFLDTEAVRAYLDECSSIR